MNNMHFLQVCPSHWWLSHLAHYRYFKRNLKEMEVYNFILFVLRFMTPIVCYWIKENTLFSYILLYFVNCEFGFSNPCLLFDVCIPCHTKASHELCSGTRNRAVKESHLEAAEVAKWAQRWNKISKWKTLTSDMFLITKYSFLTLKADSWLKFLCILLEKSEGDGWVGNSTCWENNENAILH